MNRPYEFDEDGVAHHREQAEVEGCEYTMAGDSTREGVIQSVDEIGDGLCPDCLAPDERIGIFRRVAERIDNNI